MWETELAGAPRTLRLLTQAFGTAPSTCISSESWTATAVASAWPRLGAQRVLALQRVSASHIPSA